MGRDLIVRDLTVLLAWLERNILDVVKISIFKDGKKVLLTMIIFQTGVQVAV